MGKTKPSNEGRQFSQEQYDMLKSCSDKKDMTEWNEWRENIVGGIWVHLEKADLKQFCLKGASLYKVNLKGAKLQGANLQGAEFTRANLREADLNHANMQFVKFNSRTRCISLRGKDFYGSPVFKKFIEDSDYLEDFKRRHPNIYSKILT
jgi:uncharacterized protein YjbI with pentapeptide repeats